MAITAFSKFFKRELDVQQILNLYAEMADNNNLSEFIKVDIECPCCGVTGARIVKEGVSSKTNLIVKQAHFAFTNDNGEDAHLIFCDYYAGDERTKKPSSDEIINISESRNEITEEIRKHVCTAIHNQIFQQQDIRNMREWFYNLRSTQDFLVEHSNHQLNVLRKTIIRSERNRHEYTIDLNIPNNEWFDLDEEVYESLATKFPYPEKVKEINNMNYYLTRKTIVKRAISLSKKNHGQYEFDRNRLFENYKLAMRLSFKIIETNEIFKKRIGLSNTSKRKGNNPLMAYSATLLFVNEWDLERAIKMHYEITTSKFSDENLGNVVGLNPFIHYDAWLALRFVTEWKKEYLGFDFEQEFIKEKKRLKIIYQIE